MRKLVFRNIIFFITVFLFGCALSKNSSLDNAIPIPPESPSLENIVTTEEQLPSLDDPTGEVNGESKTENVAYTIEYDKENSVSESENRENKQVLLDSALDFYKTSQEFWSEGNLERALEALDEAYLLVLQVDSGDDPDISQQKEDLRFMVSKRILEIYASRYTAVNGNHKAIPLIMNEHVQKEIKLFQNRERKFFIESYKRSGKYREKIVKELRDAGLPVELSWLPLIESGFKVRALSRARALGLWQFIPSTGYKFGLNRNTWIDERLDPEKATLAAIDYLKELHQIFGDWTSVLAAYNCGESAVLKVIRQQKINYLDNFWDLYTMLPRETARYVPRFLATLHILHDPAQYGFTLDELDTPVPYETAMIEKPVQLKVLADKMGISHGDLVDLNPELRHKATPPAQYSLKVPEGQKQTFLAVLDTVPKWKPPQSTYVYHRVRKGQTLSLIAMKYRTSVRSIVRVNNLRRKHFIRVGQKLKIPLRRGVTRTKVVSKEELPTGGKYRVRKGDSLWLIAKRFNTNTKTLKKINNLRTTRLYVGQILHISR
jgi:membrane-bound lytic murein transglycosylase D